MVVSHELAVFERHQRRREIWMDLVQDDKKPVKRMGEYHDEKKEKKKKKESSVREGKELFAVVVDDRRIVGEPNEVSVTEKPACLFRIIIYYTFPLK